MTDPELTESDDVTRFEKTQSMKSGKTDTPASSGVRREVGMKLGEFNLLRRLGKGGMAEVWLAEQTSLHRNVALKLLRSDMMEDETYVKRFEREARAAAGLNHPNIVQVYTVGVEDGQHFIAQEYVHGQTLKEVLKKRGPLDANLVIRVMKQVASALHTASERGIVHRDIKPENIMLTSKGECKVADFGLAQLQGGERLNLTQEGVTMGTPLYMSPEQVSGQKIDHRSDIYSFGVTCYNVLAGKPPYQGDNAVTVAFKHLHEAPEPIQDIRSDLPLTLCAIVERMMAKEPADRYQSHQAILNDIRKLSKARKTGEPDNVTLSKIDRTSFPVRRPAIVLPLLCLVTALIASGMGWTLRTGVPPRNPETGYTSIPVRESAREQYIHAMWQINDEDAFKAVIQRFKHPSDKVWVQRAYEQLVLLYLKDRRRREDARKTLGDLDSFRNDDPKFHSEARIGQAYLYVTDDGAGGVQSAKTILQKDATDFERYLSGSWQQLEQDVRNLVAEAEAKRESN